MAEPYQEGKKDLWAMRSRVDGHDIYVSGWGSKKAAKKEMAVEVAKLAGRGKPKGFGPEKTTVGQALQDYGLERLPFMKGARQEAQRINRYLRAVGLHTLAIGKAGQAPSVEATAAPEAGKPAARKKVRCFKVLLVPPEPRVVHRGLVTHRRNQEAATVDSDNERKRLAGMRMSEVMTYHVQPLMDALDTDGLGAATVGLERALLRTLFNHASRSWHWCRRRSKSDPPRRSNIDPGMDADRVMVGC